MNDPFASDQTPIPARALIDVPDFDPRAARVQAELDRTDHRGATEDYREEFRPQGDLPEPDPRPGFVFRWVRVADNQQADTRNVSRRMREGWEAVTAVEQPRVAKLVGRYGVNQDGNIEIGGLMLCKLPLAQKQARDRYYARHAQNQIDAVNNNYGRDQDPRMPKLAPEHRTTVSMPGQQNVA